MNTSKKTDDISPWDLDSCEFRFDDGDSLITPDVLPKILDSFCTALDYSLMADKLISVYKAVGRNVSRVVYYFSSDFQLVRYAIL